MVTPTGVQTPFGDAFRMAVLAVQTPPAPADKRPHQDRPVGEVFCAAIAAASPPDIEKTDRQRWLDVSRHVIAPAVESAHARYRARAEDLHWCARISTAACLLVVAVGAYLPLHAAPVVALVLAGVAILCARAPADLLRMDLRRIEQAADHLGTELMLEEERRSLALRQEDRRALLLPPRD